jgi:hypothetical protein
VTGRRGVAILILFLVAAAGVVVGTSAHRQSKPSDAALIETLGYEYDNGGLFQFFWNTRGADNDDTLAALERGGDKPHAEVFRRAVAAFEAERPSLESAWQSFDDGNDLELYASAAAQSAISALDDEWGTLPSLTS